MKFGQSLLPLALAAAFFAGAPVAAQQQAEAASPEVNESTASPALWRVSDEDTTIYLFGTFHFLPEGTQWYTPAVAKALESSNALVMELGPEVEDAEAGQAATLRYGVLEPGKSLRAILSEEQNAQLALRLKELEPQLTAQGLNPAIFDRLKPWYAFLRLTVAKFVAMGFSPGTGVESILKAKAKEQGMKWYGLETLDYQFSLFNALSEEEQVALLMQTVEGLDEIEELLPTMADAWRVGDADSVADMLNEDMDDTGLMDDLLYRRNANWADWIDRRLDLAPGTVFIAVGAGHLAGERSVQDYLAQRDIESVRIQ